MKIIDCFTFYNELKMLKFRLEYLYDTVDKFILVEANLTHAGNPKPLFFQENKEIFSKYHDKIIHIIVEDMPTGDWTRENFQRNCIDRGIKTLNLENDDIVIISDLDEIPNRHTLKSTQIHDGINSLIQSLYWYNLNTRNQNKWYHAKVVNYKTYCQCTPETIRMGHIDTYIPNGGWHFSYFGDALFIQNKLQQFAHQELNIERFTSLEYIEKQMNEGKDIYFYERGFNFDKIEINPAELPENYEMLL